MTLGALGLVAALALAVVFAAAGVAKLADLGGTRTAVGEFGAPKRLVAMLALVLPTAEITVAILVVAASSRAVGAVGALALLGVFSAAISVNLARGRTPDCHCFGQLHSAPAGWKTLVRNGILAILAGITLAAGVAEETPSVLSWAGNLSGVGLLTLALSVTFVALGAAGVAAFSALLGSYGKVLLRLEDVERRLSKAGLDDRKDVGSAPELGLDPGTPAPGFVARDMTGVSISLDDLLAPDIPLLLLFTSPACGPCQELLPNVAAWQDEYADRITVAIASGGDPETAIAETQGDGLEHVLVDHDLAIYDAYRAAGTPSAVLISPDGAIASHVAPGSDWIEQLLLNAVGEVGGSDESVEGLPVGSLVPDLTLPGTDAQPVSLVGNAGEDTLVLFWNPDCGFCSSMRDDLLNWEQSASSGAPRLVVVSSGDEASTKAEGFSSVVAFDPDFVAGAAFGANGTPMAVLIDGDGRVASPLVAGAEAVFALAGGRGLTDSPCFDHIKEGVTP